MHPGQEEPPKMGHYYTMVVLTALLYFTILNTTKTWPE
jgi:hypothetical protein